MPPNQREHPRVDERAEAVEPEFPAWTAEEITQVVSRTQVATVRQSIGFEHPLDLTKRQQLAGIGDDALADESIHAARPNWQLLGLRFHDREPSPRGGDQGRVIDFQAQP